VGAAIARLPRIEGLCSMYHIIDILTVP